MMFQKILVEFFWDFFGSRDNCWDKNCGFWMGDWIEFRIKLKFVFCMVLMREVKILPSFMEEA